MGMPEVVVDGEVLEVDPPRQLVQTWRGRVETRSRPRASRGSPTRSRTARPASRRLTVTHELEGAPMTAAHASPASMTRAPAAAGPWVLSDLKTLLETGESLPG